MAFTTQQLITQLYVGYYNRAPDPEGLNYWIGRVNAGVSLADIADSFAASPEAIATYPFLALPNVASAEAFLEQVYQNLFNRGIDDDGKAYYAEKLASGATTPGQIIAEIQANANTNPNNTDGAILANKVAVGVNWVDQAANTPNFQFDAAAKSSAGSVLVGVDATEASVTAANAKVDTFFDIVTTGETFTLTEAIDNFAGTAGNDTFIAGVTGAGNDTLNPGDKIDGGAGTDTLTIYGNVNAAAFAGANIKGVENVNAQLATAGATALDVSANADVKQATIIAGSSGGNTVTLTKAQEAGIQGNIGTAAGDIATFAFSDATAATNDVATLNVNGATADGVTIAAIETLNVEATGKNNVGTLTLANATTLNLTGAGSFAAAATAAALKTVDASANTGGLTLTLAGAAVDLAIKGSTANDTLTTTFAALTSADVIDLGAGDNDTLLFSDAATITTAAQQGQLSKVTGVEELGTVGTALTVDGDLVSQTRFSTSGVGSFVVTDAAQGTTLEFGAGVAGGSTAAMKLGANTLNVELQGSSAAAADVAAALAVTGSATVNVSSTGSAGIANNVLALTVADNQLVNLTGSQNTTLTVNNAGGATGVSIDASTFTGKANITATAQADIVKGGAGADIIAAGDGADVMTGGAGADEFVIVTTAATADAAGFSAAADTVTDFVSGTDKLDFNGAAGSAANYVEATSAAASFAALLTAADAALDGTVQYYAGQVGSDTYVFYDADGTLDTALTEVVKLTGVSLEGIAFTDIQA
jgi:hypothetical protein